MKIIEAVHEQSTRLVSKKPRKCEILFEKGGWEIDLERKYPASMIESDGYALGREFLTWRPRTKNTQIQMEIWDRKQNLANLSCLVETTGCAAWTKIKC